MHTHTHKTTGPQKVTDGKYYSTLNQKSPMASRGGGEAAPHCPGAWTAVRAPDVPAALRWHGTAVPSGSVLPAAPGAPRSPAS